MLSTHSTFFQDPVSYFDTQSDERKLKIAFKVMKEFYGEIFIDAFFDKHQRNPTDRELINKIEETVRERITDERFLEMIYDGLREYTAAIQSQNNQSPPAPSLRT